MSLLEDLDEAIDSGGAGETVLVTHELLCRCHRAIQKLEKRKTVLALIDSLGLPGEEIKRTPVVEATSVVDAGDWSSFWRSKKAEATREFVERLMRLHPSNQSQRALAAGIDRKQMRRLEEACGYFGERQPWKGRRENGQDSGEGAVQTGRPDSGDGDADTQDGGEDG